MKRKQIAAVLLAMSMAFAAGCGNTAQETEVQTEDIQADRIENIEVTDEEQTESDALNDADSSTQAGTENTTAYTWEEITIFLPNDWEGKYTVETDEAGFSFTQTASMEKEEGMGFLFGIYKEKGTITSDMAGLTPLAFTNEYTYYMVEPTDVCYYYEDKEIASEYQQMYEAIGGICASIKIDAEDVNYNSDEYIFPLSNTSSLKEENLVNYTDDELRIARNEIYARHGRKFESTWLQNYFNSCSWYQGTVASDQFDESVLNQVEKDNLELIKKAEENFKAEHPYPKLYDINSEVKEDLDGDGTAETISYAYTEKDGGSYEATITINGTAYNLEEYGAYMEDPYEKQFAITDITSYENGLEIAVMDYGPSYDPVTHFFTFDGELHYIGCVGGFPFSALDGYNGFALDGMVKGTIRTDLIHTCYGYTYWSYDYDNKELIQNSFAVYQLVPEEAHELYVDLPVYADMDVSTAKSVIKAQKEVFILESDSEEWILVKGKDGSKGYVHIVEGKVADLSKDPTEVFSNVVLVD